MSDEQYQPTQRAPLESEVKVLVPLYIPRVALENGYAESMAAKYCGWTAKVIDSEGNEIDNPLSAVDAYADRIKAFTKEEARAMLAQQGEQAGREQALSQFDALFGG